MYFMLNILKAKKEKRNREKSNISYKAEVCTPTNIINILTVAFHNNDMFIAYIIIQFDNYAEMYNLYYLVIQRYKLYISAYNIIPVTSHNNNYLCRVDIICRVNRIIDHNIIMEVQDNIVISNRMYYIINYFHFGGNVHGVLNATKLQTR